MIFPLAKKSLISAKVGYNFSIRTPRPYNGKSFEDTLAERKKYAFPFMTHYYKEAFYSVEGYKEYLFDHKGKPHLDLMAGISCINIGHSHPRITKIYHDQVDKILHMSPIYMHQYQGEYSKMLCEELGPQFDSVYLCNSGSQANDFVTMLLRLYTGRHNIFSIRNAYHGMHGNAASLTNIKTWNGPLVRSIDNQKVGYPLYYRSHHNNVDTLIQQAEQHMETTSNGKIAGFIAEPVMGAGGIIPLPQGYLKRMFQLTRKFKGLCVADQVQTGFGRIGKQFWGHRWQDAKPDIVVTAKAMANGYPMAAVITRKQIMDSVNHIFFNTFGGGILQCRLGIETLKILKEEKLAENSEIVGNYMLQQFKKIEAKSKVIGNVRGKGMLMAIQMVKNKETKEPAPEIMSQILDKCKERGVLFGRGGTHGHAIRVLAPLCLSMENAKKVVNVLDQVTSKI